MERNKLKVNSILNLIKTFFSIAFPLITFPYISRKLLPINIGKINFATSYISYFSLLAMLGITTYAIRECAKVRDNQEKLNKVASEIFSINFFTTCISYVILIISLIFLKKISEYRLLIIIYSTSLIFTTLGADWINTAKEDFAYITIRTISFQIISLILMFIFVHEESDYYKYAIISVISTCGAAIANIRYRKKYCKICLIKNMNIKKHMKSIILLFVMSLSATIFNSADITMLGILKGDFEVGIYTTASKIQIIINQIVSSLLYVLIPRLSFLFEKKDYNAINKLLRRVLSIFIVLGLPCFVGVICLAEEIILLLAGSEYITAVMPLRILMFSFLFALIGGNFLGNIILIPAGKEKKYMIICCFSTIVNVFLNFILIPKYSINAAAFTTALCSLLTLIILVLSVDKNIKFENMIKIFISPIIGSFLIFIICFFIKKIVHNIYLILCTSICISVFAYFGVLFLMKNDIIIEMNNTLKNYVKKIIKKKNV